MTIEDYNELISSLSKDISLKTRKLEKYKDYLPKVQKLIGNVSPIALNAKMTESNFEKGAYFVSHETLSHGELINIYKNLLDAQKYLDFATKRLIYDIDELESEIATLNSSLENAQNELSKLQNN